MGIHLPVCVTSVCMGLGWAWVGEQGPVSISEKMSSRKVLKPRDLYLELWYRSEIWQALRQQCCRCACHISKRYHNLKYQSRGFETLRDLTKRRLRILRRGPDSLESESVTFFSLSMWLVVFIDWWLLFGILLKGPLAGFTSCQIGNKNFMEIICIWQYFCFEFRDIFVPRIFINNFNWEVRMSIIDLWKCLRKNSNWPFFLLIHVIWFLDVGNDLLITLFCIDWYVICLCTCTSSLLPMEALTCISQRV